MCKAESLGTHRGEDVDFGFEQTKSLKSSLTSDFCSLQEMTSPL
jgi:hypothetical protein